MESVTEMQYLGAALAMTGDHVLAHFPIHRRLLTIFDGERAAFDEQIALERRQAHYARKRVDKFRVDFRIKNRVRDVYFGRAQQIALHILSIEIGMVEPDGHRTEKSVEVDQAMTGDGII